MANDSDLSLSIDNTNYNIVNGTFSINWQLSIYHHRKNSNFRTENNGDKYFWTSK